MSIVTQRYVLGVSPGSNSPRIRCSMGDTSRDIKLLLYDSDGLFSIPNDVSAVIKGTKSNNVGFLHSCIVGDNYVIFTIVEDMSDIPGIVICEIQLTDSNGGIIGTSNFVIQVENAALSDDSDIGDVDTDIITGIITDIEVYKSLVNKVVADYKDETHQAIEGIASSVAAHGTTIQNIQSQQSTFENRISGQMDAFIAGNSGNYGRVTLWESRDTNGIIAKDTVITLSEAIESFDYVDIYSFDGDQNQIATIPVDSVLPDPGYTVRSVNVSTGTVKMDIVESRITIVGTTFTIANEYIYQAGQSNPVHQITQSNKSSHIGEYGILKVVGRKLVENAEVVDIRIGADGVTYQSAGAAVRTQIANIVCVYKLSVPGSSAVLSGNLTSGDFAKAYSAFVAGKGVYAVKEDEVYQLVDASSSSMSYCNTYIGSMKAIKKIVTYSNDTFEMSVNFINGGFVSYDNTNSGLSATTVQAAIDENTEELTNVNERLTQEALLSYGILVNSAERWMPFESDCDNLTPNRIYIITYSADVAHVPYTNFGGYLFTFTGTPNVNSTGVQIAVRPTTTEVWKRVKWGGTWGPWTNLFDSVNSALSTHTSQISALQTAGLNDIEAYGLLISNADRWATFESDCNNLPVNRIVVSSYNTGVSNLPFTGFNGFFFTFVPAYNTTSLKCQIAIRPTTQDMYIRTLWGGNWSAWTKMAFATDVSSMQSSVDNLYYTNDIWKVFHRVGIIGDSLASGESASNEGGSAVYHDLYQFSWGQCMARDSGNTYYNFSKGGLTTRTWMTDANYGYALASQQDKLCDAYIIGLGQNDAGKKMTVGSTADIDFSNPDNNADTFYGNYAKIIQKMQALAPKAPIFVMSRPTVPASNAYETAIRAMPSLFGKVYLLDMYKHVNAYYDANSIIRRCLRSGHYNAVGYQVMSKHIEEEISNVIKENLDDFLQVEFINTEWSWA